MTTLTKSVFSLIALTIALASFNLLETHALGEDAATISIPAIGINTDILESPLTGETWDVSHLYWTVSTLETLPTFGSTGNIPIVGHSTATDGNPDIFYDLHLLEAGDEITVTIDDETLVYVVDSVFNVSEYDLSVLEQTDDERLTLLTCALGTFNDETGRYDDRTVVIAYPA